MGVAPFKGYAAVCMITFHFLCFCRDSFVINILFFIYFIYFFETGSLCNPAALKLIMQNREAGFELRDPLP